MRLFAGIIAAPNSHEQSTNSERTRGSNCATNQPDTGVTAFAFSPSLLHSHCAANTPQLRNKSLCVWRRNRQSGLLVVRSIATGHAQFVACNPSILHEHAWNCVHFVLHYCRGMQVCTGFYAMFLENYNYTIPPSHYSASFTWLLFLL